MTSQHAESAREQARRGDGKFGTQPLAEADVVLDAEVASGGYVEDDEIKGLKADWEAAYKALKASGMEYDADHPVAKRYRDASDTVNHANRKRDYSIATNTPYVPTAPASLAAAPDPMMAVQHVDDADLDLSGARPVSVVNDDGDFDVTPGVIDEEFEQAYDTGRPSLALAIAIARDKDWDVVVTYAEDHDVPEDEEMDEMAVPERTRIFVARAQEPAADGAMTIGPYGRVDPENVGADDWADGTRYHSEIVPRPSRGSSLDAASKNWDISERDVALADTFRAALLEKAGPAPFSVQS